MAQRLEVDDDQDVTTSFRGFSIQGLGLRFLRLIVHRCEMLAIVLAHGAVFTVLTNIVRSSE